MQGFSLFTISIVVVALVISSASTNLSLLFNMLPSYHRAVAQPTQAQQNFLQYNSDKYKVGIQYPSGWILKEQDDGDVSFNLAGHQKNIVTIIPPGGTDSSAALHNYLALNIDLKPSKDLSTYLSDTLSGYTGMKGFKIVEANTNAILAGQPAYILVFTDSETFDSKTMEIGTINDSKGYFIDFQADPAVYDTYLPTIDKMIRSLQTPFSQVGGVQFQQPLTPPQQPLTNPNAPDRRH